MQSLLPKCTKEVGDKKTCIICDNTCIKYGRTKTGRQRYQCKHCSRIFLSEYVNRAYHQEMSKCIVKLLKEGCGMRSIARLLEISLTTVLKRIRMLAVKIEKPFILFRQEYELDEICTYVKKKTRLKWIVYAIRKDTKEVVDFIVGTRTNKTLKRVTDTLVLSNASKVYTDRLPNYKWLLPKEIHCTKKRGTNHIERKNLTLRTHLKRLNRRTICFSKSKAMLIACLKIYFWS